MGLYYNIGIRQKGSSSVLYPASYYADLATIPVITPSEITRDRYQIPGRMGELVGQTVSHSNAHVQVILQTKAGWMTGMGSSNLDALLKNIKKWVSGAEYLYITNLTGNSYDHVFEVIETTITNEVRKDNQYGQIEIDFEVFPVDYDASGITLETENVTHGISFYNTWEYAYPIYIITLTGTPAVAGHGVISNNAHSGIFSFDNVTHNIVIDTRREIAYEDYNGTKTNMSASVDGNYEDLVLVKGSNIVSVSEGFTLTAYPMWGNIV